MKYIICILLAFAGDSTKHTTDFETVTKQIVTYAKIDNVAKGLDSVEAKLDSIIWVLENKPIKKKKHVK